MVLRHGNSSGAIFPGFLFMSYYDATSELRGREGLVAKGPNTGVM